MTRSREAWTFFWLTRVAGAFADAAVVAAAFLAALALRFDFAPPPWNAHDLAQSFATAALVHLAALVVCGVYALSWRRIRLCEMPRYVGATFLAFAVLTGLRVALPDAHFIGARPPYSVSALLFVFSTLGFTGTRVAWRFYCASRRRESELLRRDEMRFGDAAAARFLAGRTVLVTGAGGSIGSEIVRQTAAAGAARILMVERCEHALYEIDREMRACPHAGELVPLMADVCDRAAMAEIFARYAPAVVLHAAAYKHVPLVESNPEAGWRNNVEGTRTLAEEARAHGVGRFVLVSTDKAVRPASMMGRTKREAEKCVMALDTGAPGETRFCAVRFGNVFGSSGSVVPLFREQIARGGPVTVTHPDMRRYFMTVGEAVSLVLQAASRDESAIYTLDMGESVSIVSLAEGMIRQAGLRPYVDVPIVFTGVRPGEKIFEEIDISGRSAYRTEMAKIYITRTEDGHAGD